MVALVVLDDNNLGRGDRRSRGCCLSTSLGEASNAGGTAVDAAADTAAAADKEDDEDDDTDGSSCCIAQDG